MSATAQEKDALPCALYAEREALNWRALQSELMVAALICGKQAEYNRFIERHAGILPGNGDRMREYFTREFGEDAQARMDSFVTAMAGEASKRSLDEKESAFCDSTGKLFGRSFAEEEAGTGEAEAFASYHNVDMCTRRLYAETLSLLRDMPF